MGSNNLNEGLMGYGASYYYDNIVEKRIEDEYYDE